MSSEGIMGDATLSTRLAHRLPPEEAPTAGASAALKYDIDCPFVNGLKYTQSFRLREKFSEYDIFVGHGNLLY
jgi:hypothetical protein